MSNTKYWCFTVNNPEGELPEHDDITYVVWELEQGDSGTPHWQGYVEWRQKKRLASCKKWLATAHFEPRKGTAQQAADYCKKEPVAGPWERGEISVSKAGQRSDLEEVRQLLLQGATKRDILDEFPSVIAKYPRFVELCMQEHMKSRVVTLGELSYLYPWQKLLMQQLEKDPHPRTIYWVHDRFGNKGKTYLAKWLVQEKGAFYTNGGKHTDIAHAYNGESIVIFDYVRDSKEYVGYGVIEQLKNGILFSPKYESGMKVFNTPHVVVFANFAVEEGKFSDDRVRLLELDSVGSVL